MFHQNLLIPLDLSRLRQIVIKLFSRPLTEGLAQVVNQLMTFTKSSNTTCQNLSILQWSKNQ